MTYMHGTDTTHYWYSESRRTACSQAAFSGSAVFGDKAYDLVDCLVCRSTLQWPDPVKFPNLSTHPNHVTNKRGITVIDDPETRKRNAKEFGMERPEILDD